MFLLFNVSSIFPGGGQLTPFAPTCGRPWPSIMMSSVVMTDMSKYGASDGLVVFYSLLWRFCVDGIPRQIGTFLRVICIEFVYLYFPVLFCLSVSVK